MFKKALILTTAATGLALAALPAAASHRDDDRAAGAVIGGVLGAAIGSNYGGDGAVVGGLLGAVTGAAIADGRGYYYGGPRYYGHAYYPRHYGYGYGYGYRPVRPWGARDYDRDGVPNRWDRRPNNPYRY